MLQFQVAGAETGTQRVLAGSRPFEVRGESRARVTKGSGVKIPDLDGSVHGTVIIGVWYRNYDVPRLAVNILVPCDCGDLEIAAREMDGEVRRRRDFHGRSKIVMRCIPDCQIRMRATGPQIGGGVAGIACKRDADTFIRAGSDDVITAI